MVANGSDMLVVALEACAEALEQLAWRDGDTATGGSLPRMRPPSLGMPLGRMVVPAGVDRMGSGDPPPPAMLELATEIRDAARAVPRGAVGRGWIHSLLARASWHLDESALGPVRMAAQGLPDMASMDPEDRP